MHRLKKMDGNRFFLLRNVEDFLVKNEGKKFKPSIATSIPSAVPILCHLHWPRACNVYLGNCSALLQAGGELGIISKILHRDVVRATAEINTT